MKKLTLNLDTIRVDSFDTASPSARGRGTVQGHGTTITVGCTNFCTLGPCVNSMETCQCTIEFPSAGQNNCTTLIEE
jgi:hypothetical protein